MKFYLVFKTPRDLSVVSVNVKTLFSLLSCPHKITSAPWPRPPEYRALSQYSLHHVHFLIFTLSE